MRKAIIIGIGALVVIAAILIRYKTPLLPKSQPQLPSESGEVACITGVAVPREQALASNASGIRAGIQAIKQNLKVNIIWQLFPQNSNPTDWQTYFDIARDEDVQVIATVVDANYENTCQGDTCDLGPTANILTDIANHPEIYSGQVYGVLLVDEPIEDGLTPIRVRSLYSQAKDISPATPIIVGWSRQLYRFPKFQFSDGMCDICLISALEYRRGELDETELIANQSTSRKVIRAADPLAVIISSVPVFGQLDSKAGYDIPSATTLQHIVDILLSDQNGNLDGLMWQSWMGPTTSKSQAQDTLSKGHEDLRRIVRATCE